MTKTLLTISGSVLGAISIICGTLVVSGLINLVSGQDYWSNAMHQLMVLATY